MGSPYDDFLKNPGYSDRLGDLFLDLTDHVCPDHLNHDILNIYEVLVLGVLCSTNT